MLDRLRRRRRSSFDHPANEQIEALERRLTDLEGVVEALQDAVHREWVRRDKESARLEKKTDPKEVARALGADARRRGL
jgi:hypothetical protein